MKIHIITPIYNESYLLPFFLKNYKWAKRITFIYDEATTDNSLEVISKNRNKGQDIDIIPINFENGFDDEIIIKKTNEIANKSDCEWVCCIDADEFIMQDLSSKLTTYCCLAVAFHNVYPNKSVGESDLLDIEKPLVEQRRYGYLDGMYVKPVLVFKGEKYSNDIRFTVGKHQVYLNGIRMNCQDAYYGLHLNNVNLDFAKKRRLERFKRMSEENHKKGYGVQYFHYDEKSIEDEFNKKYEKIL